MGVQWRGLRFVAVLAFVLSGACFPDPPKRDGGDADGIEAIDTEDTASPDTLPDGRVKCWGSNTHGQLGLNLATNVVLSGPSSTAVMTGAAELTMSNEHVCVVTTNGQVKCWGNGANGRLGTGSTADRPTPSAAISLGGIVQHVSTGYAHTCAVLTTGAVKCWGSGANGALGPGTSGGDVGTTSGSMPPANVNFE